MTADPTSAPGAPASIASGDILILAIEDQGTDTTTGLPTVSGGTETWTQHPSSPAASSGATRLVVYWARASQAAPTMPSIGAGTNHTFAAVARFTGGTASGDPWATSEYAGGNNAVANGTVPGFTVAGADRLCVFLASSGFNGTNAARFSAWAENTTTVLSSITERFDQVDTIGGGGGFGAATALISSGGTTSGMDFTEGFLGHGMISLALSPPAAPGVNVDTPGAMTWTGQALGLVVSVAVAAGAMTWTGANDITLNATSGTTITVTVPGASTWTGQTVGLATGLGVVPGAMTWAGATDITLQTTGPVIVTVTTPGAVTLAGQAVGLKSLLAVGPGELTWAGAQVSAVTGIVPTPGSMTFAGQAAVLQVGLGIAAGAVLWQGSAVTVINSGVGVGLPVDDPMAVLLGIEAVASTALTEGTAILREA